MRYSITTVWTVFFIGIATGLITGWLIANGCTH
jgi:hypothetical protein